MVSLDRVSKTFGGAAVLSDLSLEVAPGELVGLVGPNGAGKSTLLRILIGIVFRDSGSAWVHGLDPDQAALAIRHRTSYLPGETNVYGAMTGARFLEFAASFHQPPDPAWQKCLTTTFELPLRRKVRTYSAGMKQKLALCATLAPDLDLFLLDEPDRALDATARLQLRDLLRTLHHRGKTVLLSSHHLTEIEALASRQVFILDGRRVPDPIVMEARARLRSILRVQLRPGARPPAVFADARQDSDGIWRITTDGDALAAIQQFTRADIMAAELGTAPLEELYQTLTTLQEQSP